LKDRCLNLFDNSRKNLWTFDLEGRLVGMYVDGVNTRRTLDNRFFSKSREIRKGKAIRTVHPTPREKAERLLDRGRDLLGDVRNQLPRRMGPAVEKIIRCDMASLERDARKFSAIYLPISILPPDQYMALVLQITEGCTYNRCLFCQFYRDRPFRIKTADEVEHHLFRVRRFFGDGLRLRRSVFLGDANAMVIPQDRLVPILDLVNRSFPEFDALYSFVDVFTGIRKTSQDFRNLRIRGVRRLHLGVESGNRDLLTFLRKPQEVDDVIELCRSIREGGIHLGLIFLVGAGGRPFHDRHLEDSLRLIREISPEPGDMVYLSEFYETPLGYREALEREGIPLPDRWEIREMAREFKSRVKEVVARGVAVPLYDIHQFFY
ncbi:MAG: radical SAM protein, partial [Fidelibacterota bacterium]